jgi:hypothetical protein
LSNRKKIKQTYQEEGQFLSLPHALLNHPDFLSLNWASQALLIHIGAFYNGKNNGDLSIPISVMSKRGWARSTLNDAKKELLEKDWIRLTRQGEKHKCSLYALSWRTLNDCKNKLDIDPKTYRKRTLKT